MPSVYKVSVFNTPLKKGTLCPQLIHSLYFPFSLAICIGKCASGRLAYQWETLREELSREP